MIFGMIGIIAYFARRKRLWSCTCCDRYRRQQSAGRVVIASTNTQRLVIKASKSPAILIQHTASNTSDNPPSDNHDTKSPITMETTPLCDPEAKYPTLSPADPGNTGNEHLQQLCSSNNMANKPNKEIV